ncbi:hypothetical protein QR680_016297 [Steinernema hermaphroditum]|uniref:Uncharacterized protein n=1 Tax=Steinernema hermaphroditum TaxID=289476 RepID=A0AA39LME1_9BILA|nr:hypothetical protein QR680_016297 [Steinernema hermaphroditum]
MNNIYETAYNRILDVAAFIHIPVKIFSILIVLRYSPQNMRFLSSFLLNGLIWNFGANLIFTFMHVYPMFPALCFRSEGLLSFLDNELFNHILFLSLLVCVLNCIIAMTMTFSYRYIIFVYANENIKLGPVRTIVLCTLIHIVVIALGVFLYSRCVLWTADYPFEDYLSDSVFCFKPDGLEKTTAISGLTFALLLAVFAAFLFTLLLLRNIKKKEGIMHQKQLDRHRRTLWILIVITSIPMLFGALPLMVVVVIVFNPHLLYAQQICLICIVILANHGSVYAIALILALKPYREAAKRILLTLMCMNTNSNDVVISKRLFVIRSIITSK